MAKERWTPLQYNGEELGNYLISNFGRVVTSAVNRNSTKPELFKGYRLLATKITNRGYTQVFPYLNSTTRIYISVHRAVWESFVGEIPTGLVIDHKNNNKNDNRLVNLQLLTKKHNSLKYHRKDKLKQKKK